MKYKVRMYSNLYSTYCMCMYLILWTYYVYERVLYSLMCVSFSMCLCVCMCAHRHTHTHTQITHNTQSTYIRTYIHTTHTASVLCHSSPTIPPSGAFGKVYKGVLILPAYSPQQGYTKTLVAVKTIKSQCVHGGICVSRL